MNYNQLVKEENRVKTKAMFNITQIELAMAQLRQLSLVTDSAIENMEIAIDALLEARRNEYSELYKMTEDYFDDDDAKE